jgi:D-arabinose 1-dehydrogenase-like Zn-dependent alcohol dehydrogenase
MLYVHRLCDMKAAAVVPCLGSKWEVKDVSTPEPSTKQVLIKVHASEVCHTGAFITEDKHPAATTTFPRSSLTEEALRYFRGAKNKG